MQFRVQLLVQTNGFLAAAPPLLEDFAAVLVDSGMRDEEAMRLRWENISWVKWPLRKRACHVRKDKGRSPNTSHDAACAQDLGGSLGIC